MYYFDKRTGYNFAYTKPELSSLNGAIVHGAKFYAYAPWHYYENNPNEVWLDEVKADWDYITMNWETKPWPSGERPNYGFKLHPNGRGQTHLAS